MYRWASSEERAEHFKTLKSKTLLFSFTLVFISSPSVLSALSLSLSLYLSQQSVRFHFLTSTWFVLAAVDISHPPDHHTSLNSLFFVHISHCSRRKREPTFFSKKKKNIWTRENRHRRNNYSHRMHHHHHNHNQT